MDVGEERRVAVELFNEVWTLLRKAARTPDENDRMLHAAHASRYHWGEVGALVNLARGEWQVSRVYATLGRPEPALYHAGRCLDRCQSSEVEDFDLPYAYEALARAHAVAGNRGERERYERLARTSGERIADPEDRDLLLSDLARLP